jgi:hypothetical protein
MNVALTLTFGMRMRTPQHYDALLWRNLKRDNPCHSEISQTEVLLRRMYQRLINYRAVVLETQRA